MSKPVNFIVHNMHKLVDLPVRFRSEGRILFLQIRWYA